MSTATATQNDDLIILSDNISSTFGADPVISQDLNFNDNNSIISFDPPKTDGKENQDSLVIGETNTKQESNIVIEQPIVNNVDTSTITNIEPITNIETVSEPLIQETKEETKELDSSIDNLFGNINFSDSKEETPTNTLSEQTNTDLVEENANLFQNNNDVTSLISKEEDSSDIFGTEETKSDESIGDMNTILSSTIAKLKKRQTGIAGQKSQKTATIDDLEAKIKDLKEKVAYLKKEIVFLDDENIKIDINIGNLESMKTGKTIKTPTKTREHNTKKLTKQIKPV